MVKGKKHTSILLTCGPRLCEMKDFYKYCKMGICEYRIHLGKTDRDNLKIVENLMETQMQLESKIDIYIDIPTTRPRLGKNLTGANNTVVCKGERFNIVFRNDANWKNNLNTFENNICILHFEKHRKFIKKGSKILLKDGSYTGLVTNINEFGIEIMCTSDVKLYESESVMFPEAQLEFDMFDDKTIEFLSEIKKRNIKVNKFIISFCHNKETIISLRKSLSRFLGYNVSIMAKIEDMQGVLNVNEIGEEADAIMIGRGDLGPLVGFENLPRIQEQLIIRAKNIGKKVYVATQFLEELAQKNHICSPELNDIYLALCQNADGIMLSGEAGGSPNSSICINVLYEMINFYERMEKNMKKAIKRTQILATMGPTLQSVEDVVRMIGLGVCQFRIHMGLRTRDFCGYYRNAMRASEQLNQEINILLDLPSTRPRVVNMEEYTFKSGEFAYIVDVASPIYADENNYKNIPLPNFVSLICYINIGEHIMFRDGHVVFEVKKKFKNKLLVQCIKSDLCIKTGASSCFSESEVIFQPIDQIDISYLKQMRDEGLCPDRVAISFASTVEQVNRIRDVVDEIWPGNKIELICKIESKLGLKNIDALLNCSDGIMVARGDLLLCINAFEMPQIQMKLADKCIKEGKVLIIATEFFERYAESGIVNRAELSDVALAVRQGADSIMLARETGNSDYCYDCVELINAIINKEIEGCEKNVYGRK